MICLLPVGVMKGAADSHFSYKRTLMQLNRNNHLWGAAVVACVSSLHTVGGPWSIKLMRGAVRSAIIQGQPCAEIDFSS